jgi:hypothetical protein
VYQPKAKRGFPLTKEIPRDSAQDALLNFWRLLQSGAVAYRRWQIGELVVDGHPLEGLVKRFRP